MPKGIIYFTIQLFDIVYRNDVLRNVIKAITYNLSQLALAFIFGVIIIYIFSIIAFFFVPGDFYLIEDSKILIIR